MGAVAAGFALGLLSAPPTASAATACTESSNGFHEVDVSYSGNFYSRDGDAWVGGLDPWEIAVNSSVGGPVSSVDVVFNFYSGGTLYVDQDIYDYNAGDSLVLTFDIGQSYYVSTDPDEERALLPAPYPEEPKGPLPTNDVIISPKDDCP